MTGSKKRFRWVPFNERYGHYRRERSGSVHRSVTLRATRGSLDSCIIVFGQEAITTAREFPDSPPFTTTFSYTVPLGALVSWTVERSENNDLPDSLFVSGDQWGYSVLLWRQLNEIREETSYHSASMPIDSPLAPTETKSTSYASVLFSDESMARRVAPGAPSRFGPFCRTYTGSILICGTSRARRALRRVSMGRAWSCTQS